MKSRPKVKFSRSVTTDCTTGDVTDDTLTARLGAIVIAKIKWSLQANQFKELSWQVEWTAHSLSLGDIEQVVDKLKELRDDE